MVLAILFAVPAFAQHSIQTDDGVGHSYLLVAPPTVGPSSLTIYTFPVGGGTLLTSSPTSLNLLLPSQIGHTGEYLTTNGINASWAPVSAGGGGSVTIVSVTTANGVSGSVATSTTTPAITLTLGAITPTSVAATGTVTGTNITGTNTGDQTITLTGPVTGSGTGSFATTITNGAVTLANLASIADQTFVGNNSGASGSPQPLSVATVKTMLGLSTSSSPSFTGLTISGLTAQPGVVHNSALGVLSSSGVATADIINSNVTYAKIQNAVGTDVLLGNTAAAGSAFAEVTFASLMTGLGISGTNSGDVTLAGTPTYITIAGQVITRNAINLATAANITGLLPAANGGTGVNTSAAANGTLLIGNGSGVTLANLTAGTGISVTNGVGTISLSAPVMVASGASHAAGIAPDPGITAGTTKFLREDATWATPVGTGAGVNFDVITGTTQTAALTNDLFNVSYVTTGSGSAPGAFINSKSKGGSATATGLTVTADGAANGTVIKGIVINTISSSASSPTTGLAIASSTTGAANATGLPQCNAS